MTAVTEKEVTSIAVLADRLPAAMQELKKLAKKANRYGCPDIRVSIGKTFLETRSFKDWDGETREAKTEMVELLIEGDAPRVGNHEFLARIELTPAGNLVDVRPGVTDLDARFHNSTGYCEHCNSARNRKEVFAVRDLETGRQLQIGRTCLRDYMGLDNPAHIAARFAFFREAMGLTSGFGKADWAQSLEGLLSLTSVCIRLFGWCSRAQAQHDESLRATSAYVYMVLNPLAFRNRADQDLIARIVEARTDGDYDTARATINWVRNEMRGNSDYEHNLKVLFSSEEVHDERRLGLVVSAVSAYHRAKELEMRKTKERAAAQKSKHVGNVKDRLRNVKATLQFQRVIGGNEWGDRILVKFVDVDGNIFTWFTGAGTGLEIGDEVLLTGTVKDHGEYNGVLETQLTRCQLTKVN